MPAGSSSGLYQDQAEIVVGFGEVGSQPNRCAELGRDVMLLAPARPSSRPSALCASARFGFAESASRTAAMAPAQSGVGCDRDGRFRPASQLAHCFIEIAGTKIGDAEVNVDRGGRRHAERSRAAGWLALRPNRPVRAEPCRERHDWRPPQDRASRSPAIRSQRSVFRSAVPQRDAEVVVSV